MQTSNARTFSREIIRRVLHLSIGQRRTKNLLLDELTPLETELLSFKDKGYLREIGWIQAFENKAPIDGAQSPIPWVTYAFIEFIQDRLTKELNIFEFGSGNSTQYYAARVKSVTTVEHDEAWAQKVSGTLPKNVELIFQPLESDGAYCRVPKAKSTQYHIIIVDGRDRVNCCKNSLDALTENGVVVLDDSERDRYQSGIDFLKEHGFRQLDFWGISPGLFYRKCTSIFYKPNNCLGI